MKNKSIDDIFTNNIFHLKSIWVDLEVHCGLPQYCQKFAITLC